MLPIRASYKALIYLSASLLSFAFSSLALAANSPNPDAPIVLTADRSPVDPLPYVRVWRDTEAIWTFEDFLAISSSTPPDIISLPAGNFGVDASAHWITLTLLPKDNSDWIIDNQFPGMDRVSIYQRSDDGSWKEIEAGRDKGKVEGDLSDLGSAFRLDLREGQESTIVLRFQNIGTTLLPLGIYEEDDFMRVNSTRLHYKYVFIGFMLAMIIYNLILFLATRHNSIKWYLIFQLIMTAFQVSGNALHLQILPHWLVPQSSLDYNLLAIFVLAVPAIFFERFMGVQNVSRPVLFSVRLIGVINLLFLPALLLTSMGMLPTLTMSYLLVPSATLSTALYLLLFSIHAFQSRSIDSYIFAAAWVCAMGSLLVQAMLFMGAAKPSDVSLNIDEFLLIVESLILAAGLSLRIQRQLRGAIVTSQKLVAAQLKEIRALEENDQQSQQLVRELQHELRTPVAAIVGLTDQLQTTPKRNTKEWELLVSTIEASGRSLKSLIDDTLNILTSANPKADHVLVGVDLNETLKQCVILGEQLETERPVNIELAVQQPLTIVRADRNRLIQVVLNLMENALIHSGCDEIRIQLHQDSEDSVISISDNGCGIPNDRLNKVFSPYYTTNASGGSTGQGLGIARRIIEGLDGMIEVSSKLNVGTTFTIRLPIKATKPLTSSDHETSVRSATSSVEVIDHAHAMKLLVVDDNEVNLMIAKGFLSSHFNLVLAPHSLEVEQLIDAHSPDLLLLDLVMPERHGFEVIADLKANPKYAQLPIIVASALSDAESIERALDLGATDYLSKPLIKLELTSRINAQLSYRELDVLKEKYETLTNKLEIEANDSPSTATEGDNEQREILVNLISLSHEAYAASGNASLASLAENSGLWSVSLDGSRMRARTLEKYTNLKTMPKRPNWKKVSSTANFVLTAPNIPNHYRNAISELLETLIQHRKNQRRIAGKK